MSRLHPGHRTVRLADHDYGAGGYHITICTAERRPLFGCVDTARTVLSRAGDTAAAIWAHVPDHHSNAVLDAFVVMPDHVHLLLFLRDADGRDARTIGGRRATACCGPTERERLESRSPLRSFGHILPGTVPAIIRGYKSAVTRAVRLDAGRPDLVVWQREYHDRLIKTEADLETARRYIAENPARWRLR